MPEYWADANTPTVSVTLDHSSYEDPALVQAWSAVPMPSDAEPAKCSDENFAVLQTQPDGSVKEWEFWKASESSTGQWTAEWGGAINNVLTDRGEASPLEWTDPAAATSVSATSTDGWNVTASGISMLAGVITDSDLASGSINHAVAMAVTAAAPGEWMWPAQRTDGSSSNAEAIPEGAHLRLNPSVNINALNLTPLVKMIAEAAQKYGIIVRDQTASADVFYAEQPAAGQPNPVTPLLDGESPSSALAAFPWSDLEVLNAPMCTSGSGCSATDQAVISVSASPTVGQPTTLDTTNSVLNFPRSDVRWDMSGTGDYSVDAGTAVTETYVPTEAGSQTVSVQITTSDGSVTTGNVTFTVLPAPEATTSTATTATPSTATTSVAPSTGTTPAATPTPTGIKPTTGTSSPTTRKTSGGSPSSKTRTPPPSEKRTAATKAAASRAAANALKRRSVDARARQRKAKRRREKSRKPKAHARHHAAGARVALDSAGRS